MTDSTARALALFGDYVLMSPDALAPAMATLRIEDPQTHSILTSLLASDARHKSLDQSPLEALQWTVHKTTTEGVLPIDTRLGAWRITRVMGAGGMGAVYEVQRDDGHYQQRAALKRIHEHLNSPRTVNAFLNERKLLASMDHPGIVPLLDGGVDEQGRPWFVMRFVDGRPIDQWCDVHRTTIRARVELLVQVCDALAYAHQHMILHQDIKPSNVLVTRDGVPLLLDFGLATMLGSEHSTPQIAFTQGYSAPEAFKGITPSAALDVYSLGMLMYQLLCGVRPLNDFASSSSTKTRQPVQRLSFLVPDSSDNVAHLRGASSAAALRRLLAGDLEAIAARAIAENPGGRYPSAVDMRDDLQRWLDRRPVRSRNGGWLYRSGKFLHRHALVACLSGLVLIASAAGLGINHRQSQLAEREAASLAELANVFEQTLGAATISGLGDSGFSSKALLSQTEARVRSLAFERHPKVRARGMLLLARSYAAIGDYQHAAVLVWEASSLYGDDEVPKEVVATQAALQNIEGYSAEALRLAQGALASLDDSQQHANLRLQLLTEISRAQWDLVQPEKALASLETALRLASSARATHPEHYIELLILRGNWRLRMQRFQQADADLKHALDMAMPEHPLLAASAQQVLVRSLMAQERYDEALPMVRAQLQTTQRVLGETHPKTGVAWLTVADTLFSSGDLQASSDALDKAKAIIGAEYGEDHPEYAEVLRSLGMLMRFRGGSYEEMIAVTRRSESLLHRWYPPTHERIRRVQSQLANRLISPPPSLPAEQRRKQLDEAITILRTLMGAESKYLPTPPFSRIFLARALTIRNAPGDLESAQQLLIDNARSMERNYPPSYSGRYVNDYALAYLRHDMGQDTQADALLESVITRARAQLPNPNARMQVHSALLLRAAIASLRGQRETARRLLADAHHLATAAYGPDHPLSLRSADALKVLARTGKYDIAR